MKKAEFKELYRCGRHQLCVQTQVKYKRRLRVKEAQELNKKVCGNCYNYEYDGYVFVDELGERMRPGYLTSYFPQFIQRHGLRKMRFHDLCHSCVSRLLADGVPLKQIQEWLGHSDFSTTANIYAHLDDSSKLLSAQAMVSGIPLPEAGDFKSKWSDLTEESEAANVVLP